MSAGYVGGGAILIIENADDGKDYLALVKRSDDTKVNPGVHSGFFGGSEPGTIEEELPRYTTYRELREELLIIWGNNIFGIVTPKIDARKVSKSPDNIKGLYKVWNEKAGINLKNPKYREIKSREVKLLDYFESKENRKSISILRIKLPVGECIFLDGEGLELNDESINPNGLLDRRIDLVELNMFKKWWREDGVKSLTADFSYQGAKRIDPSKIKKLSPSLARALTEWGV